AALVRCDGTVAQFIHAADIDFGSKTRRRKLPKWTADAHFGCQYHVCANAQEVIDKLAHCFLTGERILAHPDNAMRPDFVLLVLAVAASFLLLGSAKCLSSNLSGEHRDDDFDSTG